MKMTERISPSKQLDRIIKDIRSLHDYMSDRKHDSVTAFTRFAKRAAILGDLEQAAEDARRRLKAITRRSRDMAHRFNCRHCGKGFLAKPWDRNGMTSTCRKAKCEKASGIYRRPVRFDLEKIV